ncbi:(Fe-S)-binding protein [uncultured Serinicoccus sp.]|uniref:(Fe-S)-binding protein n=1 Tax=uncultured Serinicoccus sp. TaxID=735514 RepID=UPI002626DBEB|nr:(Fe-S)-binding protein [uncultured Serinicoccus sp.]
MTGSAEPWVARPTVALFATCFNDTMWPQAPRAVVTLLERLGCRVVFPREQTCCGQMFTNTGYADEATPLVRRFVDVFAGADHVVSPSGSCVGSVREQHAVLARRAGDAGLEREVRSLAPRVLELSELLVDVLGVTDVGAYYPHRVTYHPTCHSLRMLGVGDKPLRLLRAVRGIDLVDLPSAQECCGFGGTFAMKNADTSIAMGADKARHVRETGAEVVVAGDNSCLAHIGGVLDRQRSGVRTVHLAQVLASTQEVPS